MRNETSIAGCALAACLLIACGGGGGGGGGGSSPTALMEPTSGMPSAGDGTPESPSTRTGTDRTGIPSGYEKRDDAGLAVNPNGARDALYAAATAVPLFGSVTQSSNVNDSGVSTDRAEATFDGTNATIRVTRSDGSYFTYGTNSGGTYSSGEFTSAQKNRFLPDHWERGRAYYHVRSTETSYHADYIGTGWDSDNLEDFAVWGYWLRTDGANPFLPGTKFDAGAFIDWGDPDDRMPLPATGSATYVGEAQWLYHHESGGWVEIGQGIGALNVTAGFGDNSLTLCIGCAAQSRIFGDARGPDGTFYRYDDHPTDYRLEATATINSDGSFRTTNVTLTNPSHPITSFEGSVGGQFSTKLDANNVPVHVSGTHGGKYVHQNASGAWVGTFGGKKQ